MFLLLGGGPGGGNGLTDGTAICRTRITWWNIRDDNQEYDLSRKVMGNAGYPHKSRLDLFKDAFEINGFSTFPLLGPTRLENIRIMLAI